MGFAPSDDAEPVKAKTRPWGENRPLTAPPKEMIRLTETEAEALRRIIRSR